MYYCNKYHMRLNKSYGINECMQRLNFFSKYAKLYQKIICFVVILYPRVMIHCYFWRKKDV